MSTLRVLLALLVLAAPSPELQYFRYQRAVQNTSQLPPQTCLPLEAALLAHAAPGLSDLRLYRQGTEMPYAIHIAGPAIAAKKPISVINLGTRTGATAFDTEMPEGSYSDISLDVDAQDFIATVAVTGSVTNQQSANTELGTYTIFDLTHQKLGRSTVLHLPASDFRYLHFRIHGRLRPERIVGVSIDRGLSVQMKYQLVAESTDFRQEPHASVAKITVPAHVPVDRLIFALGPDPPNFTRSVRLSVAPVGSTAPSENTGLSQPETSIGNILRVHSMHEGHQIDEERLEIEAPQVSFGSPSEWIISIDNGDDAPLHVNAVRLEMLQRSLCFENKPVGQFALYYGDPALAAPRYDYAALFAYQPGSDEASAGPERLNSAYRPRPDQRPFSERHPALLWIALIAVVALLASVALRSAKRTDATT